MSTETKPKHIGRNIGRLRELRGIKQDELAFAIGVSQQAISYIENSETVDDEKLVEVAKALGVTPEAIKNFSEENVINYFNNFYDNSANNSQGAIGEGTFNNSCIFNPIEKLIEAYEENKKLYERLLEAERRNNDK
ncbi:MAG TPA: helix-turn-helix transcriptional regulator [Flavobacterium sp.]|jgi:transcriptional regulator with XRE-family HTH domain